jgi:excisionase family DNA binding protein
LYFLFDDICPDRYIYYMELVSAKEAARILGVTDRRVRAIIKSGHLPARKIGGGWVIAKAHLKLVEDRKPGRPKQRD